MLQTGLLTALITLTTLAAPSPAPSPTPSPIPGDPKAGAAVFMAKTCSVCHAVKKIKAEGTIGPSLDKIGTIAAKRVKGQSAEVYLRKSILEPNAYITPGYQPFMPELGPTMTDKELRDLIAFLKSLK